MRLQSCFVIKYFKKENKIIRNTTFFIEMRKAERVKAKRTSLYETRLKVRFWRIQKILSYRQSRNTITSSPWVLMLHVIWKNHIPQGKGTCSRWDDPLLIIAEVDKVSSHCTSPLNQIPLFIDTCSSQRPSNLRTFMQPTSCRCVWHMENVALCRNAAERRWGLFPFLCGCAV